jgi:hypothetical protein
MELNPRNDVGPDESDHLHIIGQPVGQQSWADEQFGDGPTDMHDLMGRRGAICLPTDIPTPSELKARR